MLQHQLNMNNDNNHQDGYCLLSYTLDETSGYHDPTLITIHQTNSYCLRTSEENKFIADFNFRNTIDPNFTFSELKAKHITSNMLISWSASIDLAEQYQIFLNSDSNTLSEEEVLFYNCTSTWFGPLCRFTFDYGIDTSLDEMVRIVFESKFNIVNGAKVACYEHLPCQTLLSCLDWREICDRKIDCLDGFDENNCWQLEVNECADNEYRCHNGQCIPIEFLRDGLNHPDCLDRTDEGVESYSLIECSRSLAFRCEEHTCKPGGWELVCGDGQCTNGFRECDNGRKSYLLSDFCSNATACSMQLTDLVDTQWCAEFCPTTSCINDHCPMIYEFRFFPLLFGHVRFMYSNKEVESDVFRLPEYVCYDEKRCADFLPATEFFDNFTCRHLNDLGLNNFDSYDNMKTLVDDVRNLFRGCLVATNQTHYCNNYSTLYQCENSSKCISKQRLVDDIQDCPFNDDETCNQSCSLSDIRQRFKCSVDDQEKCFASLVFRDGKENCDDGEDENDQEEQLLSTHIYFQMICDRKTELLPVLIDEKNETDETECEHWPCNNIYSRCDLFWSCKNGADEVNCPLSICPEQYHDCIFPDNISKVSCLPIIQAGDGVDNCLGGTDERRKYSVYPHDLDAYDFHCWNDTEYIATEKLCNGMKNCRFYDDETFCSFESRWGVCDSSQRPKTNVENFFCNFGRYQSRHIIYFKLRDVTPYPLRLMINNTSMAPSTLIYTRSMAENSLVQLTSDEAWWCNRGIPIRIRMNMNTSELFCLCPSSYYGDRCQYQSQRVSLSLQIRVSSDWRSLFIFLITLIDNERNIQSHNQIQYLPILDCAVKFNAYLLYSTRPKNSSKNYSVQIEAFNQWTLNYRASWIFPLRFPFLPVHRLPVLLTVPYSNVKPMQRCWPPCAHGQCFHYVNDPDSTFCRCQSGWSGVLCDVEHKCDCAPGSLCISNSICLCPPDRFGPRCHLYRLSCHSECCMNGGQCVPMDVRHTSTSSKKSICICPEGYIGDRCEHQQKQTEMDISFHHKLTIPSSLLVHFIAVQSKADHNRTSIIKKIAFDQYSVTFFTLISFNIAIAQITNQYYLIILQEQPITSGNIISTQIMPSHRCRSMTELFNETFASQHLLKRIKYYHIPCKQKSELVCFYDNVHFCLCTLNQQANCFEFDHNMTYDCGGYNYCQNEGHCFQNNLKCPEPPICACRQCYFGSRCQFSTKGAALSLDTILGYHIHPRTGISQQPIIVKVAIALTTIMFAFGFINNIFCFQTFRGQETRSVGCGLYLFSSSIISMITIMIFILKFSFLLASQIGSINNRSFLHLQCVTIDFFLRFLVSTSDWLNACVATERAVNVLKGIRFKKVKSKQMAKWIILIVVLFTSCTYIYDPLHRRLIDDEEEQRVWCVSQYSPSIQVFDWLLNIFHFSLPFAINCISALIIIITAARTRSNSQKAKSFKEHLHEQLQNHKHLLISPFALILLAVPRLIISFLAGCMESARDSWLYLIGYFISFIPPLITFLVFVLPSAMYKREFNESFKRIWQR